MTKEKNTHDILNLFYDKVSSAEMIYAKVAADITSQIVAQRLKRSMTQKEFAQMLGCSQAYISKLESAEGNYTVRKLCEIAVRLDMDLEISLKPNTEKITRDVIEKVKRKQREYNNSEAWNVVRSEYMEHSTATLNCAGKETS